MADLLARTTDASLLRADLHVHTDTSPDSLLTPERLVALCMRRGIRCLAITDHNRISGAWEVARAAPEELRVIVGEEVCTAQGELLGLFLTAEIPPGLSALETAARIRAQGGLVGLPHPSDRFRHVLPPEAVRALIEADRLDFLEGRNGRVLFAQDNRQAEALGYMLGRPLSAGSDAHCGLEVGRCGVLLPPFDGPESFLRALEEGRLWGDPGPAWMHLSSILARLRGR
ncbi:MAG: PHP domain-containing protein [Chloroflexia bacterium]